MDVKRVIVITGHYGSGKTNISVNMALKIKNNGKSCNITDLDIVNPYFRTADFKKLFSDNGINLTVSKYANSNLDIPSLSFDLSGIISDKNKYSIIDVGGDDAGAHALGRYNEALCELYNTDELDVFYVVNCYRYLTKEPVEALGFMREIEVASGLRCTGIINNSNLGVETNEQVIKNSLQYAEELSKLADLPVVAVSGKAEFLNGISNPFPVEIYVKTNIG